MPFATTPAAYDLLHRGTIAFADIEHNGVRVDTAYLADALKRTAEKIKEREDELRADPIYKLWRRRYGENTNFSSPAQLAGVVYGDLGYKAKELTTGGDRGKASEAALEGVDLPFVKQYFRAAKMRKTRGTYLVGIQREMVEHDDGCWYVHPHYNLNTVATFRSSADNPNWQNVPVRNLEMAEMVRRCYVARPGFQLVEIDYAQVEVRVAACYNRDPNLIADVSDPARDMHRDIARKLFFASAKEAAAKPLRNLAKASFVFAEFYGDFYPRVAEKIWDIMGYQSIEVGGVPVRERLAENGITERGDCDPGERPRPGTFEAHVRAVEEWFWERKYPVYKQWKRDWFADYQRNGGFRMLTGFAVNGRLSRNDAVNYPIQGSAFHCLLWAMPRIIGRLRKFKMRSRVVGEIHDCVVADVHPRERDDYINLVREIMVDEIAKAWDWLIVPLAIEAECCEPDASWFEKRTWVEANGRWVPK